MTGLGTKRILKYKLLSEAAELENRLGDGHGQQAQFFFFFLPWPQPNYDLQRKARVCDCDSLI